MTARVRWPGERYPPGFHEYAARNPDVDWETQSYWSMTNDTTGEVVTEGVMRKDVAEEFWPQLAKQLEESRERNTGRVHGGHEPGRLRRWLERRKR